MSDPRLYLYRKAGRAIWDAEMWLPDGTRKVWRTRLADKEAARMAAQERLNVLAESAPLAAPCPTVTTVRHEVSPPNAPAVTAEMPPNAVTIEALTPPETSDSLVDRFDKWFFADLASLWGAAN